MFSRFRILCAVRRRPYGVTEINRLCERILFEERLIRINGPWYPGRPVMVIKNDYGMKLFNVASSVHLLKPSWKCKPIFATTVGNRFSTMVEALPAMRCPINAAHFFK
ncbi:MAG: hypothetical protein NTW71_10030 [Deltaproteobacteria bacterium]|nr:hypothetical protein [Deltaproteobacteria bacterium]